MKQLYQFLQLVYKVHPLDKDSFKLELKAYEEADSLPTLRIRVVCQYIADNYAEPLSLSNVADSVYLSPEAFCRYFKKHTGLTFKGYLNRVRVVESCRMLKTNNDEQPIANIAYACGFGSISNFNRTFKHVMGMSPSTFLKQDSTTFCREVL
ncbi:helix-turn-helix domain-containing protein [Sphingobacterium faecale]|uniref:Helix-turn-helix transcriptional regulator n=1 Tax=Sphingobacterium faecale TaxID=2803775 RepID=A0ABS1QYR7_9SPHI|nr:AraC family transcriptional regulator [Sphingobacterium faecale]MBL1407215.1 helix-turn-helix transcriptional regulator [Sphingobacterium faecale]